MLLSTIFHTTLAHIYRGSQEKGEHSILWVIFLMCKFSSENNTNDTIYDNFKNSNLIFPSDYTENS